MPLRATDSQHKHSQYGVMCLKRTPLVLNPCAPQHVMCDMLNATII